MSYADTTFRTYGKSKYEKTDKGWAKQVEEKQQTAQSGQKEYTDEELAGFARKASDASLKKAGAGANERMRIAAKKELLRRQSEGASEPEPSENPFDDGMKKGLFDEFPTRMFGETEYINKGQGWEILEKGRGAQIGEIRDWKGGKYQKTANGWVPYTQGQGGSAKKDDEGVSKDVVEKISSMSDSELAEFKEGCAEIVDANKLYIEFRKKTKWSGGLEDSEKVVAKYESYIKAIEQEEAKRKSKADSAPKDEGASEKKSTADFDPANDDLLVAKDFNEASQKNLEWKISQVEDAFKSLGIKVSKRASRTSKIPEFQIKEGRDAWRVNKLLSKDNENRKVQLSLVTVKGGVAGYSQDNVYWTIQSFLKG